MAGTKLTPEKITSPIQLMAAWFALIVLLTSILLTAAHNIEQPTWAAGFLVIFCALLIMSVLGCVILMLTKFRPHLQEGKEYAQWLRDQNKYSAGVLSAHTVSSIIAKKTVPGEKSVDPLQPVDKLHYRIKLSPLVGVDKVQAQLEAAGFEASLYADVEDEDLSLAAHQAIWVGYRVPANLAVEAIQIAIAKWPHLKFIELSNDGSTPPDYIHDQLYFGGSTETAIERGLGSWKKEELLSLDTNISTSEFHNLVRSKYS